VPKRPAVFQPPRARVSKSVSKRVGIGNRGTRKERGYGEDWMRLRAIVLAREPLCRTCLATTGRAVPATVVDHIQDIADRPDLRLEESNLQTLCRGCHNRKTARKQNADRRAR